MKLHRLLPLLAAAFLAGCNGASEIARDQVNMNPAPAGNGFLVKSLHRGLWTRKYALFIPKSYRPGTTQRYPVIIFLHGVGEGSGLGEGDLKNLTVGLGPAVARRAETFDFIVIFPQSDGGWAPDSDYTQDMFTALANTAREYPIDPDRVYLTGLSTGGYGTWAIGAKHPDQFAALVPMGSNGSDLEHADRLTGVSVRAYCSVFGDIFAGSNDQDMVKRIKEANPSASAEFIQTSTLGHNCWEDVYGGDELFSWLRTQRRTSGTASAVAHPISAPEPRVVAREPANVPVSTPRPAAPVVQLPAPSLVPPPPAPAAAPSVAKPTSRTSGDSGEWVNTSW